MTNQKKEELKKQFLDEYYKTDKLTYIEEDGTTRADTHKVVDYFLSQFDNIINEKIERIKNMLPTEEEIEKQKECGEYNCYSKQRDYFTLEKVITILKE